MDLPTIAQLCAEVPGSISALPGQVAPLIEQISAVHVSDLADPTPYLSGGELLLTTGLSLPRSLEGVVDYIARLVDADVAGLGLGLGPSLQAVPLPLREAAAQVRMPLLVVPPESAFLDVTKAYWKLRSETDKRELTEAVTAHSDLVQAAFAGDPAAATLRSLAHAVHGWAAIVTPARDVVDVYPSGRLEEAVKVAGALGTTTTTGGAPLTFELSHGSAVSYPVTLGSRIVEYLLVGTETRLSVTQHRVGLTAASLMTLGRLRREQDQSRAHGRAQAAAMLVDLRLVEAAARLASRFEVALQDDVRIVVVDTSVPAAVEQVVRDWCPEALPGWYERQRMWFLVPPERPDAGGLVDTLLQVDPAASGVISDAVALDRVHDVRLGLQRTLGDLPAGTVRVLEKRTLDTSGLEEALGRLLGYRRGDLVGTVVAYLRHWGQWEEAARELHVHRNTIRHRITRAREVLGVDLTDLDVAAELWLMLRRDGLA